MSKKTISAPSRRTVLFGIAGGCATASVGGWIALNPSYAGGAITPQQAHDLALSGDITLIDIRTPREWDDTGVGVGAHPIDLRRDDFDTVLSALVDGDRSAPIALMCARGVRSARLADRLTNAGFTQIINVPQGMLGSNAGLGWIESGLPLQQ